MKTVYSALAVDSNNSALSPERQLAVVVAKALSKKVRVTSMSLVGWPLLLLRVEETGAYLIFDESGTIETSINRGILQNYSLFLDKLSQLGSPEEFLGSMTSISWGELRGKENFRLKGLVEKDLTPLIKNVSLSLNLIPLDRRFTEERASLEMEEWKKIQQTVSAEIARIDEYVRRLVTISEMFIGKLAEERQRIEAKYRYEIDGERQKLEDLLKAKKPQAYEEVKKKLMEYAPKLAEIYGILSKTQLDAEAGLVSEKQIRAFVESKNRVIREIDTQINSLLESYRAEVRSYMERIRRLEEAEKRELEKVDERIQALRDGVERIRTELLSLKQSKEAELDQLASLGRRTIFADEKLEVIIPFLVVKDEYGMTQVLSPQRYSGRARSLFGFGTKLENISVSIHEDISDMEARLSVVNFPDNVRIVRGDLEKGLEWLESEGWKVRRIVEEYYIS
ncbi:MAG: hypothetical protein RXS23_04605 [Metallosphaera yellowstonensis]|jgi:hypothetical protein|uniref:Uncharacterized protein n=1 Tax=Metallosphaera yellowstonensis MK1 TaxID=671065 RepID=H2C3A8_9CREN|nr:hypothetical protein [Metallosphaera yellowstonensis]EHP70729.1 hypothetical protein MetMK1DRAFT_00012320 [Metallosphaera yellowstonensis MK1]